MRKETALICVGLFVATSAFQAVSPCSCSPGTGGGGWWDVDWYYRVPVAVRSDQRLESVTAVASLNFGDVLSELRVKGRFDPNSLRVVCSTEGEPAEMPIGVQFEDECVLDDFESGLERWTLDRRIVSGPSEDSVQGARSMRFRRASLKEVSNTLPVDIEVLRSHEFLSFWAKGNFSAVLRDMTLPIVLGEAVVSSSEYERYNMYYTKRLVEGRRYALFLTPDDFLTTNCVDEIKLASTNAEISWAIDEVDPDEDRLYFIYFDVLHHGPKETIPYGEVQQQSAGVSISIKDPEGFRIALDVESGATLTGLVELRADVIDNLSRISSVQYRIDWYRGANWSDESWGRLVDMGFEEGMWRTKWDSAQTVGDGLHEIWVRAVDDQGREATDEVQVWTQNAQFDEPVNLNPSTTNFTFVVMGDNRPGSSIDPQPPAFTQVLRAVNLFDPDMIFNTGDIVYGGGFDEYIDYWKAVCILKKPTHIARGNHEMLAGKAGEEGYRHFYDAPNLSRNSYYSFDYGNSHFVILNANEYGHPYTVDEPQLSWLRRDLESHRDAEHVFVFIHQPILPYAHGLENKTSERILRELMIEYQVDYVFQGHEHMQYELEEDGVEYIITGGAGAELDPQYPADALYFGFVKVWVNGPSVTTSFEKPLVLELISPEVEGLTTSQDWIRVEGRTQPFAELTISGPQAEIRRAKTGYFTSTVSLSRGENEIVITSECSGQVMVEKIDVFYAPQLSVEPMERIRSGDEVHIEVTSDGGPVQGAQVSLGVSKAVTDERGMAVVTAPTVSGDTKLVLLVTKAGYSGYVTLLTISTGLAAPTKALAVGIVVAFVVVASALASLRLRKRR